MNDKRALIGGGNPVAKKSKGPPSSFCGKQVVRRTVNVYSINTYEKWLPLVRGKSNKTLTSDDLLESILQQDVGCSENNLSANTFPLLKLELSRSLQKFRKTNFKRLIDTETVGAKDVDKVTVYRIVRRAYFKVFPRSLLGSKDNVKQYLKNLKLLIGAGKGFRMHLFHFVRGLNASCLPWMPDCIPQKWLVYAKLILWMTESFCWRLVRSFFYVTETSTARNELFYYRKKKWQSINDRAIRALITSDCLKPLTPAKLKVVVGRPCAPTLARLRLLPKRNDGHTCRLIGRKIKRNYQEETSMANLRIFLRHLKSNYPETVDVRGKAVHRVWRDVVEQRTADRPTYFVVTDIKDAFGSVRHDKLDEILRSLAKDLRKKNLFIAAQKFKDNQTNRVFVRRVISDRADHEWRPDWRATPTGPPLPSKPIVASDVLRDISRRTRLHTLQLRIGAKRKHYLLTQGLVQGDTLSSHLCDIYYGHLVKNRLREFLVPSPERQEIFVRGMDDFLFVSTEQERAISFLNRLQEGFPDYGCSIRMDKTITNVNPINGSINDENMNYEPCDEVTFCGARFNVITHETRPDFSGYDNKNIAYAMRFMSNGGPGSQIRSKLLFLSRLKLQPIFLDETINSRRRILSNMFELFHMLALRFQAMTASLLLQDINVLFVVELLKEVAEEVIRCVLSSRKKSPSANKHYNINEVKWLLFSAFEAVFAKYGCSALRGPVQSLTGDIKLSKDSIISLKQCREFVLSQGNTRLIIAKPVQNFTK